MENGWRLKIEDFWKVEMPRENSRVLPKRKESVALRGNIINKDTDQKKEENYVCMRSPRRGKQVYISLRKNTQLLRHNEGRGRCILTIVCHESVFVFIYLLFRCVAATGPGAAR